MKGLITLVTLLAGFSLVLMFLAPLALFVIGLSDVTLQTYYSNGSVAVELSYGAPIPLKDAVLIIDSDKGVFSVEDPYLEDGEILRVEIPADAEIRSVSLRGAIAGLYTVELNVSFAES